MKNTTICYFCCLLLPWFREGELTDSPPIHSLIFSLPLPPSSLSHICNWVLPGCQFRHKGRQKWPWSSASGKKADRNRRARNSLGLAAHLKAAGCIPSWTWTSSCDQKQVWEHNSTLLMSGDLPPKLTDFPYTTIHQQKIFGQNYLHDSLKHNRQYSTKAAKTIMLISKNHKTSGVYYFLHS